MYKYLLCLILTTCSCAQTYEFKQGSSMVWWNVLKQDFPYKHKKNECYNYSRLLYNKINKHCNSYILIYHWKNKQENGSHAILVFELSGNTFLIDNIKGPEIVFGENKYSWICQFDKTAKEITNIRIER